MCLCHRRTATCDCNQLNRTALCVLIGLKRTVNISCSHKIQTKLAPLRYCSTILFPWSLTVKSGPRSDLLRSALDDSRANIHSRPCCCTAEGGAISNHACVNWGRSTLPLYGSHFPFNYKK